MTALITAPTAPLVLPIQTGEQRLVMVGVDWQQYLQISEVLEEVPGLRLTYYKGRLEIVTKSSEHERFKSLLARLLMAIIDELAIDYACFGEFTFLHPQISGLEPDDCYYIANAARFLGRDHVDLSVDPPPDLVLEIDIASSSAGRLVLYGEFGVPEVWLYDNGALTFLWRNATGGYDENPHSRSFPWLTPADVLRFFALRAQVNDREIVAQFRAWVRQRNTL
jgi:Uma2 family endonuclease